MTNRNYEARKIELNQTQDTIDSLTVEEALQININGEAFTVTMRTPIDDVSLIRGLLHAEDIISDASFIPDIIVKEENKEGVLTIVDVIVPNEKLGNGYTNKRSLLSVSSCGICGKTELSDLSFNGKTIDESKQIKVVLLSKMFDKMNSLQLSFLKSGGTHAAAIFTLDGELLSVMEDIGRHNAVDKAVGKLINTQQLSRGSVLTVSGRISYEIVIKCFKAKIPFIAAVSAPSSLAVDYAKELGITLFAFCRDNRATCYSHIERIKTTDSNAITA